MSGTAKVRHDKVDLFESADMLVADFVYGGIMSVANPAATERQGGGFGSAVLVEHFPDRAF